MKDIEKELAEKRKQQPSLGVTTITLNRLPIFQPTLRAEYREASFESPHGRITVRGRLGQNHKTLLEAVLYLRKLYDLDEENMRLRVLYDEYEVKKHLTKGATTYSYEGYKQMLEDMKQAYVILEAREQMQIIEGNLIKGIKPSNNYSKKSKGNLPPVKGKNIPYVILEFGEVVSYLFSKELKFTYDPRPIANLRSGISQAVARYLQTHRSHPPAGYHLRQLIEILEGKMENKRWWTVKEYLKEDAKYLRQLNIDIDFKKDRLFVTENASVLRLVI